MYYIIVVTLTHLMTQLIRSQSSDSFTIHLCLIIYCFDGQEHLLDHMIHHMITLTHATVTPFVELSPQYGEEIQHSVFYTVEQPSPAPIYTSSHLVT